MMSAAELFQGIRVFAAALAAVAFAASLLLGDLVAGVSLTLVGLGLFSVAIAAWLAVVAIDPSGLTGSGGGSRPE